MLIKFLNEAKHSFLGKARYKSALKDGYRADNLIYPIDLQFTLDDEDTFYAPFDECGIPQKRYSSVGVQYNPTRVAAYGFALWNSYKIKGCTESLSKFMQVADWFLTFTDGRFNYNFDWERNQSPWVSGMAQGEGISILVRAYDISKNKQYLDRAFDAVEILLLPCSEGGVLSYLDGGMFFEEYPDGSSNRVLNGFMYTLIGLLELKQLTGNEKINLVTADALKTLARNISRWNLNGWSSYDLNNEGGVLRNYATMDYHSLHVAQLNYIISHCDAKELCDARREWSNSVTRVTKRLEALIRKVIFRIRYKPQR